MNDPIVQDVRRIRDEYAAQFDYDIRRIADDIRRQEEESGRTYLRRPAKEADELVVAKLTYR